ncbi:MAG TPA: hypothetical protein VFY22_05180 [Hydrogenophaga sp.]|nr:hypothetical protein [Hydrogenophaga sp.]
MNLSRPSLRFLAPPLGAAVFVLLTSRDLPPIVASHFDGTGAANGFMSSEFYTWFMLAFVVGLPLLLTYLPAFVFNRSSARFNLPNEAYWLAPERRQETVSFLCRHMARFGMLLALLFCYSHWLVVQANVQVPPRLSTPWFMGGLIVFVLSIILWAGVLLGRFLRVPRSVA